MPWLCFSKKHGEYIFVDDPKGVTFVHLKSYTQFKDPSAKSAPVIENDKSQTLYRKTWIVPIRYNYDLAKTLPKFPKSPEDEDLIKKAINNNEFLNQVITGKRLQEIVDVMYDKDVAEGEIIIKEGATGSHMFISKKGEYQVHIKGKGLVNTILEGQVFGEIAILYNAKRLATIQARMSGKLWILDRAAYHQVIIGSNIEEQQEMLSFLQKVDILNGKDTGVLKEVSNLSKREFFSSGSVIVQQGDLGDKFYIIKAGSVSVSKEGEISTSNLKRGYSFGELTPLKVITQQATVTADPPGVECLTLTLQQFVDYFGKVEVSSIDVLPPKKLSVDPILKPEYESFIPQEYKYLKIIGRGGFGEVYLAQHKKDPSLTFALKYLNKTEIVKHQQQQHVINEEEIQMRCKSPFIVSLYQTYKDEEHVYFLMEVCLGGDLSRLMRMQKKQRFEDKGVRFITGCVLEALAYLHERDIIYRDLKPENLVISHLGYIKLIDLGFARKLTKNERATTVGGTPEYIAPELLKNDGYGKAVDFWQFGILIFELLTGKTPFKRSSDNGHLGIYENIMKGIDVVKFPSYMKSESQDIVQNLCRLAPHERLGCQRGGVQDVRNDKWYKGFDWQQLKECRMKTPYKPKLRSNIDTSNFDTFTKDTYVSSDEGSGWDPRF